MRNITQKAKSELWKKFGLESYPAEWDGFIYGGGKMSQRYWEYFKALEFLDLKNNSVVLDIGGSSPKADIGFFSQLIHSYVKRVYLLDPVIKDKQKAPSNITCIESLASAEILRTVLQEKPYVSHIVSISVLEHIKPLLREEIIKTINEYFKGNIIVATFEYHARECFFQYQLTSKTTSDLFRGLTNYYLSEFESSPIWCENAYQDLRCIASNQDQIPRWYPVAVKFEKI